MLRQQLADDKFIGIERQATRRLVGLLPNGNISSEDAAADIRYWAFEATFRYDPDRGASFSTFLYRHLQNKCLAAWKRAWSVRRQPDGGVFHYETETALPTTEENPTARLEVLELIAALSSKSRRVVNMILFCWDENVLTAFKRRTYRHSVSELLDLERKEVDTVVDELRIKIPQHLTSVSA